MPSSVKRAAEVTAQRRMARLASALVLTLSIVVAPPRAAADEIWGETTLAGGAAAARQAFSLGSSDGRFDAEWIVDLVRRNAKLGDWSTVASNVTRYTSVMDILARAAQRAPDGVRPPDVRARQPETRAFRDLADALGLDARVSHGRWQITGASSPAARGRAKWAEALGLRTDEIVKRWTDGDVVKIDVPIARLPVPLPAYWRSDRRDASIALATLVRDRPSALLYAGLMALDDETLTWLDGHRAVVDRLRDRAPALAAFARSIRIRDGAVDVPGGADAANAWRALVGQSPAKADAFLDALLADADGGRLHFFDAVMYAPASTQAAIVARAIARPAALTAIFQAFHGATTGWALDAQPFARPAVDPAWALALVDLRGGSLSGSAWLPATLERAASRDAWPAAPKALPSTRPPGDVEWIARWLFDRPDDMMARARLLRFSQRLTHLDDASPADVEIALRTFRDLPSLALTLERLGVRDPASIARVGRAAYGLSRSGDPTIVAPVLARWQMSLALIEQTSRLRPIAPADVERLVAGLADAATQPAPLVTGALIRWLASVALPALNPGVPSDPFDSDAIMRAIAAGRGAAGTRVTWEGLTYDRNPVRVAVRDLDRLLQAGPRMNTGTARALAALYARLSQDPRAAQSPRDVATELDAIRGAMPPSRPQAIESLDRRLVRAARALRESRAADASAMLQLPDVAEAFGSAVDIVVKPIVYGLAMTPLHQAPSLQAEAWSFHQIVPAAAAGSEWWRAAWQPAIAQVRDGGGSAMAGSWLRLDLALADAIVPRRFDQPSLLATAVRDAMTRDVAVRAHASETASRAGEIAERIAQGRRVLADWRQTPPDRPSLRHALDAAGMSRLRVNLASWTAMADPARLAAGLTMADVAGLGDASGDRSIPVAMEAIDGCVCLATAPPWPADDTRAYWQLGTIAAVAADLPLRLAEGVRMAGLAPIVVADLLPLAAADWLTHTDPYANDDWEALTLWPKRLDAAAIDDYLMQLISSGVLAPIEEAVP